MTDAPTIPTDAQLEEVRELGRVAGRNAGSWAADGNTSADHIRRVLAWIGDGDGREDQFLPDTPNLSGEWADAPTERDIFREIVGGDHEDDPGYLDARELLGNAWDEGVSETFMDACVAELRAFLPADDSTI